MKKTKVFRDDIALEFIKALEESPMLWKQKWSCPYGKKPYNAITGRRYRGVNALFLSFVANEKGFTDPRWCTFKQINDKAWHLKKGSKGSVVEFWMPFDKEQQKIIPWIEYDSNNTEQMLVTRYYTVFNGNQIEGIPEIEKPVENDINQSELITKMSVNMGVEIVNDGLNDTFYSIKEDKIHLPEKKYFESDYDYNATVLHELSHSTGHESRLNRNIKNRFGSQNYAMEELVAEMSACFLGSELQMETTDEHMKNHKAYIQSWISEIKEKPESLFKAIKLADEAAAYLEIKAELIKESDRPLSIETLKEKNEKIEEVSINEDKFFMPEFTKAETGRKSIADASAKEAAEKDK